MDAQIDIESLVSVDESELMHERAIWSGASIELDTGPGGQINNMDIVGFPGGDLSAVRSELAGLDLPVLPLVAFGCGGEVLECPERDLAGDWVIRSANVEGTLRIDRGTVSFRYTRTSERGEPAFSVTGTCSSPECAGAAAP